MSWINQIEDKLRENNIRFTTDSSKEETYFRFYIGSMPFVCWVQHTNEIAEIISFHYGHEETDQNNLIYSENSWMEEENATVLQVFESMLFEVKEFAQNFLEKLVKVEKAVRTIEAITEELDLPETFFAQINYDFEMD